MQVAMADGSVHAVTSAISTKTFELACYPHDGQPLPGDWWNN
jgi:hypothetical protein